jgi:hypothetical protein
VNHMCAHYARGTPTTGERQTSDRFSEWLELGVRLQMLALAVAHCRISIPTGFSADRWSRAMPARLSFGRSRAPRGAGPLCSRASRLQSRRSHRAFGHAGEPASLFYHNPNSNPNPNPHPHPHPIPNPNPNPNAGERLFFTLTLTLTL